jgi:predicted outer membrane protein
MQENKTLKGLLAVSVVAALFSAHGVQAQTSSATNATPSQTGTSSTTPNMAGKTTREGTMDNTNSTGMENRANQMNAGKSDAAKSGHPMGSMGQSSAGATSAGSGKLSAGDEKAVKDMAMADMAEVAMGKLALSKTQNSEVKAYAQQMVDDHSAALTKVQAVAKAHNVMLPDDVDAKHKAEAAKLEKLSGDAFDKAYMANGGVKDHKMVLAKLQADAKKIKDPDVKQLADQHLPVVEQHLKSAEQASTAKSGTAAGK